MSPDLVLGPALLEAVRQVAREEARAAVATVRQSPGSESARWVTPPMATLATGVPVKTVRELVRTGRVQSRLRNRSASPAQPKYLVNVDEVAAAVEQLARGAFAFPLTPGNAKPAIDLQERAARIRAKGGGG